MGGSMYLSAAATGAVVLHAAPPHMAWLFGVLLDAAALLAVHFILNGPTAADVSRHAAAESAARTEHEAALQERIKVAETARDEAVSTLTAGLDAERAARESAQREAEEALTRAEKLAAKLDATSARRKAAKSRTGSGRNARAEDLTTELRAIHMLDDDPELRKPRMGGELARRLGVSPATGRRLHSKLTERDREAESLAEEQQ
jgi:hypothetical protein